MTMRTDADGIIRTEPRETYRNGDGGTLPTVAATENGPDWSGWEAWMEGHKNDLRDELIRSTGEALGIVARDLDRTIAAQAKKIEALQLQLAEAIGALNILRGKDAPNALRIRGTFDPDALYLANDIIALNGSSFIAMKDRPGSCPGPDWQLLASAGKRGERGARGPQGQRGDDGAPLSWLSFDPGRMTLTSRMNDGTAGPELRLDCIFAGVDVDPATYSVNFKILDGTELKFSLRGLFAQFFHELKGR
jgi:hypothetical protein